ncbi:hypothetical protein [Leisingera sp. ANG-Vp]|uniref:hypothetical protein n=1 Tax=Leisingera sp. ANG-Vp TaxID=1577896 RepID=UPI000A78C934|nr:hypothetical protein [Leisingera sp. ANG-Vp]
MSGVFARCLFLAARINPPRFRATHTPGHSGKSRWTPPDHRARRKTTGPDKTQF